MIPTVTSDAVEEAARRLRTAQAERRPCPPVRDVLLSATIADAYEVQRANMAVAVEEGRRVVGWKIGLTAPVVQQQLGVDQPDFGVLFADCAYGDEMPIPRSSLLQPRVEAEVAFVLDRELPDPPITSVDVLRATAFLLPAIEVVDSRIADWDITIVDTVADNASSGVFVLGPKPTLPTDVDLRAVRMTLSREGTVVGDGSGAACLGHPVNAVVWLANTLAAMGTRLRAGDVVLSGALGAMVPVPDETVTFEAALEGLGTVRAAFA